MRQVEFLQIAILGNLLSRSRRGKRRKRDRVGPKVHFASAVADRKWRTFARSNYQIFVAFKQERQRKRSFQPRQRQPYRVDRLATLLQPLAYEMSDHFGVGIRDKTRASQPQPIAQFAMILDDAVVNDRNTIDHVRMRVPFIWTVMRGPPRVANADEAGERFATKLVLEVLEFADCAPPRKVTVFKRSDSG